MAIFFFFGIFVIVVADLIIEGQQELRDENPIPAVYTLIEGEERKITFLPHRPFSNKEYGFAQHMGVFEMEGQTSKNSKLKTEKDFLKEVANIRRELDRDADKKNAERQEQAYRARQEKGEQTASNPATEKNPSFSENQQKVEKEPTYFKKLKGFGKVEKLEIRKPTFSPNEIHSKLMNYPRDFKRKRSLLLIEQAMDGERIKQAHANSKRKKNLALPYWEKALNKKLKKLEQQTSKKIRALEKCYAELTSLCNRKLARINAIIAKDKAKAVPFVYVARARKETRIAGEN